VWRWDAVDNSVIWSAGIYRVFGLDPESVAPSFDAFLEVVHPDDRQQVEESRRAAIEGGRMVVGEYRVVRPDGTLRFVRGTGEPVRDAEGNTIALIGTTQDVTENREMAEQLERAAGARAVAQQTRAIQRILEVVLTHPTVDELLPEVLRRILGLMDAQDAAILLMNPDGRALTIAATEGVEEGQVGTVVPVGAGLAGRAAAELRPVIFTGDEIARRVVNPALRKGGFSALAAVPMVSGTEVVGVLRVATRRRHGFTDAEMTLLQIAADRAALGIRHVDLFDRERSIARTLQDGLQPESLPQVRGLEFAARFRAAGEGVDVGGDFYDAFVNPDGSCTVVVGDVSGKGPGAAAVTSMARHTLRVEARHDASPGALLSALNGHLLRLGPLSAELPEHRFCTVVCGTLTRTDAGFRARLARGGHPKPIVVPARGDAFEVEVRGVVLGAAEESAYPEFEVALAPGDSLVLYTDGVLEAAAPERILEGSDVARGAQRGAGDGPTAIAEAVTQLIGDRAGRPPRDDVAILVVQAIA
jgi:PAS domain S-box-containing protein